MLAAKGWSSRKIALELDVDRETVRRYRPAPDSKPAIPPAGSESDSDSNLAIVPTGAKAGRTSQCEPFSATIETGLLAGFSAQRIFQDLVTDHQFTGGYDAVKRFVRRLSRRTELPFRRMECAPGQELQVDFGLGAWVITEGIHGTTRRQVGKIFEEVERPALQPLPASLFPVFEEAQHTVHRDGYVEFKKAYYSAPPEYVGRQVWVRQETRLLRIYNPRREQIALHALDEPGKFTTDPAHLHSRKRHLIERGADYLLDRCRRIGPLTGTWAEGMHQTRGPQSLRVMQGLLQLAEKHPAAALEKAAGLATHHGTWRLRDLIRRTALARCAISTG